MTLKTLDKLRGRYALPSNEPNTVKLTDFISGDMLAYEIQREVDNEYRPCGVSTRAEDLASDIPAHMDDWCYYNDAGIMDYIEHFYLPKPLDDDGNPVQKGTRYKATRKNSFEETVVDVESMYIAVIDSYSLLFHSNNWDFERIGCDTQERIDDDTTIDPEVYCSLHEIELSDHSDREECEVKKTRHLLQRQRKLMGGEA